MIITIANIRKNVQFAGTLRYIQRLPRLYCVSSAWRSGNFTEATYIYAPVLVYNIISIFRKDSTVVMDVALLHVHSNISAASFSYFQQVLQINTVNRVE